MKKGRKRNPPQVGKSVSQSAPAALPPLGPVLRSKRSQQVVTKVGRHQMQWSCAEEFCSTILQQLISIFVMELHHSQLKASLFDRINLISMYYSMGLMEGTGLY